jgi:hypothetical protein
MRAADRGYLYNLQVPANARVGELYAIRVRPCRGDNPDAGISVVLLIK